MGLTDERSKGRSNACIDYALQGGGKPKVSVKMELYPANGQGYIYDNSYTKQYGLERGLHISIYDVNIGFEYALPLTKARTSAGNPHTELALQTELYGCRHFSAGLQLKVHLR